MAAKEKQANDATRTMRMPTALLEQSDETFAKLGLSFSEAVRMFLEETVKAGKLPFRPTPDNTERKKAVMRSREEAYLNGILDPNRTMLESLFKECMPESSKELTDENLRDWGIRSGLPKSLSLTTLAELYDSKLFAKEPWSGDLDYQGSGDDHDPLYLMMVMRAQTGNIAANLEATRQKLLVNAMNQYLNCDVREDEEDDDD